MLGSGHNKRRDRPSAKKTGHAITPRSGYVETGWTKRCL